MDLHLMQIYLIKFDQKGSMLWFSEQVFQKFILVNTEQVCEQQTHRTNF